MEISNPVYVPDGSITESKLAKPSVGTNELFDLAVQTAKLADNAATDDKIPALGRFQVFTSSGTFTPAKSGSHLIIAIGGGGGGSGGGGNVQGYYEPGGMGGESGEISIFTASLDPSDPVTITIGAGGTGGAGGNGGSGSSGTAGGDTVLSNTALGTVTASGGLPGKVRVGPSADTAGSEGNIGGGFGGRGGHFSASSNGIAGYNAVGPGGGGGGGAGADYNYVGGAGGNGAGGIVIFIW